MEAPIEDEWGGELDFSFELLGNIIFFVFSSACVRVLVSKHIRALAYLFGTELKNVCLYNGNPS